MKLKTTNNFAALLLAVVFIMACNYKADAQPKGHDVSSPVSFEVTALESHPDENLVRVCGELKSRPNTSACIRSIILTDGKEQLIAIDTDGFDLMRYFQWEESGEIDVEIDFPTFRPQSVIDRFEDYKLVFELKDGRQVATTLKLTEEK